jgi:O-antigen ligase
MPTYLRALAVILALAAVVFVLARAPACATASSTADFDRRRNAWLAITTIAFLANNFWLYALATGILLHIIAAREQNKLALYFFLLFAVPDIPERIPGLGLANFLVEIGYLRLLALTVLLPAFLHLRKQPGVDRFGTLAPDKLIGGYIVLQIMLIFTASPPMNAIRVGICYSFVDIFLPYYVASRSLRNIGEFRDVLMAFVVAALVLSAIGVFEAARHWLLYAGLADVLGVSTRVIHSIRGGEGGVLRAMATTLQPIVLGYIVAIAIAFHLYFRQGISNRAVWAAGLLLLGAGLAAPLSRGPWVGVVAMLLVVVLTGPNPAKNFFKLAFCGFAAFGVLLASPYGGPIIELLPFVGASDTTVTYRQRLLEVSFDLIWDHPFFGSFDYVNTEAMQELRQGQGIIDIVNSYVAVGLGSGLVGLSLFAGFFITVTHGLFRTIRGIGNPSDKTYQLGQILFAALLGIMVMIGTVSSISFIPVVYWSIGGIGVAYLRMVERRAIAETAEHRSKSPIGAPKFRPGIALP